MGHGTARAMGPQGRLGPLEKKDFLFLNMSGFLFYHPNFPCGPTAHGKLGILHRRCQNLIKSNSTNRHEELK
jgi:hypothetical protein